jgi:hypothetical protein
MAAEIIAPRAVTAEARIRELHAHLKNGSITVEQMDEMVDLLGMLGLTRTGEVPERLRRQTRH